METITHPTLVQLVAAGAVRVVVAVGQPGGWTLLVRYGLAERALAAQRSKQLRVFRKLDTLVLYLQQIGVSRFYGFPCRLQRTRRSSAPSTKKPPCGGFIDNPASTGSSQACRVAQRWRAVLVPNGFSAGVP